MSHGLLEILRYFMLALIWLFFVYATRMVLVEVRRGRVDRAAPDSPAPAPAPSAVPPRARARPASLPADRSTKLILRIVEPVERLGTVFDLAAETTLGRSSECSVALDGDTFASSVHARVYRRDGETWLEDLASTNGTFLNGERLTAPVRLREGDVMKVGHTILEVGR